MANEQQFNEKTVNHAVEAVDFDYERSRKTNWHSRTHYLLRLLNYDEDTYEVVAVTPTDERSDVLVTIQERLPHLSTE
ncbi:hypothetical protein [Haloterrigena alkaliphila]|uniref:hypothetical protein n=1 Tax=Haloterrigena alkaliphila TaxID=2816475 RepID=UPI001D000E77|nr:hypothetical protein [Haloterrigena alkaliphila]UHQ95081.1 hypothetical protein J0X25_19695 [Haloterrigena alkaliphila]